MITHDRVHPPWSLDDLFGDDVLHCPVCRGTEFTYTEGIGIFCDECEAEFKTRGTAGDPGVVIDCIPAKDGRYAISRRPQNEGDKPQFWCIVKVCESGLDDRETWCTNLDISDLGSWRYLNSSAPPMGAEVFRYDSSEIAGVIAGENWGRQTEDGRAYYDLMKQEIPSPDDRDKYIAYIDKCTLLKRKRHQYCWSEGNRCRELGRLQNSDRQDGFYFREQCEAIWKTGYWIPLGLPKEGEVPVRSLEVTL